MSTPISFNVPTPGVVSTTEASQEYSINLTEPSDLVIHLESTSGNADLVLLDANHQPLGMLGVEQIGSMNPGSLPEHIDFEKFTFGHPSTLSLLRPGTYNVQVALGEGAEQAEYVLTVNQGTEDNLQLDLGYLQDYFMYRGELNSSEDVYHFEVSKESVYSFYIGSSDEENPAKLYLKPVKGSTIEAKLQEGSPFKVFEIKDVTLKPGAYNLVVTHDNSTAKYGISGISKAKQEEMRKQLEEQMQQAQSQVPVEQSANQQADVESIQ